MAWDAKSLAINRNTSAAFRPRLSKLLLQRSPRATDVLELVRRLKVRPILEQPDVNAANTERCDQLQDIVMREQWKCEIRTGKLQFHGGGPATGD